MPSSSAISFLKSNDGYLLDSLVYFTTSLGKWIKFPPSTWAATTTSVIHTIIMSLVGGDGDTGGDRVGGRLVLYDRHAASRPVAGHISE